MTAANSATFARRGPAGERRSRRALGSCRGAAAIRGNTHKTVKQIIDLHEADGVLAEKALGSGTTTRLLIWSPCGWKERRAGSRPSGCCRPEGRPAEAMRRRRRTSRTPTATRSLSPPPPAGDSQKSFPSRSRSRRTSFIVGPLLDNPHRVGTRFHAPLSDRHSARRGTLACRVVYRVDEDQRTVTVPAVSSRSDAYRRP